MAIFWSIERTCSLDTSLQELFSNILSAQTPDREKFIDEFQEPKESQAPLQSSSLYNTVL
jgi:hypothetical protein